MYLEPIASHDRKMANESNLRFNREESFECVTLFCGIRHTYSKENDPQGWAWREYVRVQKVPVVGDKQMISLKSFFINLAIGNSSEAQCFNMVNLVSQALEGLLDRKSYIFVEKNAQKCLSSALCNGEGSGKVNSGLYILGCEGGILIQDCLKAVSPLEHFQNYTHRNSGAFNDRDSPHNIGVSDNSRMVGNKRRYG